MIQRSEETKSIDFNTLVAGCVIYIGWALAWYIGFVKILLPDWQEYFELQNYNPTTCTITKSQVKEKTNDNRLLFYAAVEYSYTARQMNYSGKRIRLFASSSNRSKVIRKDLEKYPVGKELTCYFNPDDPQDAVIEKKANPSVLVLSLLPILIGSLGFLGLYKTIKMYQNG